MTTMDYILLEETIMNSNGVGVSPRVHAHSLLTFATVSFTVAISPLD